MLAEFICFAKRFFGLTCPCCGSKRVQTSHGGKVRTCLDCGSEW